MKFTASFAVVALINNLSAVQCAMDDDLFTDDGDVSQTLSSMKQAEKAHNTKFTGLNADAQKELLGEKNVMTFSGDEFVKNDLRKFDKSFLQIDDQLYPEPRPIGEIMAQIGDFEDVQRSNMLSRTADQDRAVLAGSSLNDDEDMDTTMESIKTAEKMTGAKLNQVDSSTKNAMKTGSFVHNFLEDDHRVYTSELDNALVDKDAVDAKDRQAKQAEQKKQSLVQQQQKDSYNRGQKAQAEMAIHFMEDDYVQTHNDSDSDSSDDESDDE